MNKNDGNISPQAPSPMDPSRFGMLPPQKAVSPADAEKYRAERKMPGNIYRRKPKQGALQANVPLGAPSIAEQARALKNDVDLIYEFIQDNIDFIPNYGLHKGGLGALIDGSGNALDQSDLMVQLLTTAGYTADYVFGVITLSPAQWSNWLGINDETDVGLASQLLSNGGIGNIYDEDDNLSLNHCWVQVNIGGTSYVFDPAFKQYDYTTGIDIQTAMDYDRTTFLSDANAGSTLTADYVQNINDGNIIDDLTTYSTNLATWINENMPAASLNEILGGRSIVGVEGPVRQTDLPYHNTSYTTIITNVVPDSSKATMEVQYDYVASTGIYNIDHTFFTADIYSERLTLWFNSSRVATLNLSGTAVGSPSSAQTAGSYSNLVITVKHPYGSTFADATQTSPILAGAQTTIGSAWGISSKQMAAIHQQAQNQAIANGVAATAESMLGQSLLLVWDNFMGQGSKGLDILCRLGDCAAVIHHFVGSVSQQAYGSGQIKLLNSFLAAFSVSALDATTDMPSVGYSVSLVMQVLESAAQQQVSGITNGDPIKALRTVNQAGTKIYDANSSNWSTGTNVESIMATAGYTSDVLSVIQSQFIDASPSWRVAMPATFNITMGSFSNFYAYLGISPVGPAGVSLFGQTWFGAKGSVSGGYQNESQTNSAAQDNARQVNGFGMPAVTARENARVNMLNGRYEYSSTDLTVGNQGSPYSLSFTRSYNSALALTFQGMGFGWCHNWQMSASTNSDGFIPFGDQQAIAASAAIAALFVTRDVAANSTAQIPPVAIPINDIVTTCIVMEYLEAQLVNNAVRLQFGGSFAVFTLMPDGSYLPPLGMNGASTLTETSGAFKYTTADKVVYTYNTSGLIASIAYPIGITISFTYNTSNALTKVTNGFRTLNFAYDTYGQLNTINDGNSRTVTLTINYTSGSLTSVKDPLSNSTTYVYDERGRMTQIFEPANPTNAVITNVYDTLSRVMQQTDAYSNVWNFYLAGSRSEEVAPNSTNRILYFDALGSTVQNINALGQEVTSEYDGLERPILVTQPEGNSVATTYDANGNVLTVVQNAKPTSGLDPRTTTFVYGNSSWTSKPTTVTDPAGNVTTTTYDPSTGQVTQVVQPSPDGINYPTTNYTYNTSGQLLTTTDPTGRVTSNTYDSATGSATHNLLSTTVDPSGLDIVTQFNYDAIGNTLTTTDPNGNVTTGVYDNNRQITQVTGPAPFDQVAYITYDANGNVIEMQSLAATDANSQITQTTYAIDGKVAAVVGPVNFGQGSQPVPVRYAYDSMRRLVTVTDPAGNIASTVYDAISRPLSSAVDGVTQQTLAYTENGQVQSVTDANSNETQYQYDGFDRLIQVTYPDSSTETVSYDVNDNVLQATTRVDFSYSFTYDVLNRLITKTPNGQPTVTFTYDLAGRPLTVATPEVSGDPSTGTFGMAYDTAGRMNQEQYPDSKTVTATMDKNGNVTQSEYPDGSIVSGSFDQLDRVTAISGFSASVALAYDSASRRLSQINGNGTGQGYHYDQVDNLMALTIGGLKPNMSLGTPPRVDFAYGINDVGQNLGKIASTAGFLWQPSLMSTTTYGAANNLNQYPSVESVAYSYDGNGCLTSDGTNTYAYDYANRLVSVTNVGGTVSYEYDPLGRLVLKTVGTVQTRYLYCGMQRIEEYNNTTGVLLTRYVYGVGLDECLFVVDVTTGNVTYLHADETGSTILGTDLTGTPTQVNVFTPWGELASGSLSDIAIGYTGQFYEEETGLYFYKARHYSPTLGRFLQPDPFGYASGLNMYEYAGSDPVNFSDPLGLDYDSPFTLDDYLNGGNYANAGPGYVYYPIDNNNPWAAIAAQVQMEWLGIASYSGNQTVSVAAPSSPPPPPPPPTYLTQLGKPISGFVDAYSWNSPPVNLGGGTRTWKWGPIGTWLSSAGAGQAAVAGVFEGTGALLWEIGPGLLSASRLKFTWGRAWGQTSHGGRHMAETMNPAVVEQAIRRDVRLLKVLGSVPSGFFKRTVTVEGRGFEYHGFTRPGEAVNVGTYFPTK